MPRSGNEQFVLKSVAKNDFAYFQRMFRDLRESPHVRVAVDDIPAHSMFAYRFARGHLLSFAQRDVPLPVMKRVLRDSLRGIAALHGKGIVNGAGV